MRREILPFIYPSIYLIAFLFVIIIERIRGEHLRIFLILLDNKTPVLVIGYVFKLVKASTNRCSPASLFDIVVEVKYC